MFSTDYINDLHAAKRRAWEAMKEIGDRAEAHDSLSAEDREAFDRAEADFQAHSKELERALRANELDMVEDRDRAPAAVVAERDVPEADTRSMVQRILEDGRVEQRETLTGNTGAPVPTSFWNTLQEHLVVVGPMTDGNVVQRIDTAGGENLQIPRTDAFSTPAIAAEGTTIAESDPTFQAFLTLGAFKYSTLVKVSNEMLSDAGVDIDSYVARQIGIAIGTAANNGLTNGTGTVEPNGVVNGVSPAATATDTAVVGGFGLDDLIDVQFSVNSAYRRLPKTAWSMADSAAAQVRKLKDDAGNYVWIPPALPGEPAMLLGYPIVENPDLPALASASESVIFGNWNYYVTRVAGGVSVARSADYAFNEDITTFRGTLRVDGGVTQSSAFASLIGGDGS